MLTGDSARVRLHAVDLFIIGFYFVFVLIVGWSIKHLTTRPLSPF